MALRHELKKQGDFLFKYRSYLPLIIVVVGLVLYIEKEVELPRAQEYLSQMLEIGSFIICLLGLLIRVVSVGYSSDNTSGRNTGVGQIADYINTSGFYSLCRHPLYVGNFLMWIGIAGFTQNLWFIVAFVFMYWVYYERIMYAEEEFLIDKYGKNYLDYAAVTPAFWPKFSLWRKPDNSFSFRKVIRQEKAGILNLFLVILLLRAAGEFARGNILAIEPYWIYGFGFALLWYIFVKVIQKTTQLLAVDR